MADPIRAANEASSDEISEDAKYWQTEIDLARKRLRTYWKDASACVKLYEGDSPTENSFNILYSNTETLLPACYNQLPRPQVERTFYDDDPNGKNAAQALERVIKVTADSQDAAYDQMHRLFQQAVLGALVPGQGATRLFYDAELKTSPVTVGDDEGEDEAGSADAAQNPRKQPFTPREHTRVAYESICGKDLDYDQIIYGYARRWVDLPWLGFEHFMHKDDLIANFGKEVADKFILKAYTPKDEWKKEKGDDELGENNHGSQDGCHVTEIWNKAKKEIVFFSDAYPGKLVDEPLEDPFNLSGFFPMPEPMKFQMKTSGLVPKPIYKLYEAQAKELNRLSMRINRILNAMKVRGFYDGSLRGLKDLLNKDDNTLIEVPNAAAVSEGKTLANSIWFMPLNELVTVLQQLMVGREQCKNTIYEITGISDIMRGDTQASETFGAQNLKSKWGTQRLQKFQGEVQRYCRDVYRIVGELAGENFSEETFANMTGLPFATSQQVEQAQKTLQAVQQQMMAMPQPMPQPGGPPPQPPPIPPEAQQAQQVLSLPKWEDVLSILAKENVRQYRIDIETNSTLDPTRQEDKQDITDAMTAIANTMQSFGYYVEMGVFPMPAFKKMLLAMTRRFAFGKEVEDALEAIPDTVPSTPNNNPQQQQSAGAAPPSPEELQAKQAEATLRLQTAQQSQQNLQRQGELGAAQHAQALERLQRENETNQRKHDLEMLEFAASEQELHTKLAVTKDLAITKVRSARALGDTAVGQAKKMAAIKPRPSNGA
jgi:hypothetical protein